MYPPSWSPIPATTPEELTTPIDPLTQVPVDLGGSQAYSVGAQLPMPYEQAPPPGAQPMLPPAAVDPNDPYGFIPSFHRQHIQQGTKTAETPLQPAAPTSNPLDDQIAALGATENPADHPETGDPFGVEENQPLVADDGEQMAESLPKTKDDVPAALANQRAQRVFDAAKASGADDATAEAAKQEAFNVVLPAARATVVADEQAQIDADFKAQLDENERAAELEKNNVMTELRMKLEKNQQKYQETQASLQDRINRTQEGAAGTWNDMSAWGQLTTIISLMAGTAAGALGDGNNPAVPLIMKHIENDMQAKRSNRQNDMQLLQELRLGHAEFVSDATQLAELQTAERVGKLLTVRQELERKAASAKDGVHKRFYKDTVNQLDVHLAEQTRMAKEASDKEFLRAAELKKADLENRKLEANIGYLNEKAGKEKALTLKAQGYSSGNPGRSGPGTGGQPGQPGSAPVNVNVNDDLLDLAWKQLSAEDRKPFAKGGKNAFRAAVIPVGKDAQGNALYIKSDSKNQDPTKAITGAVALYTQLPKALAALRSLKQTVTGGIAGGWRGWDSDAGKAKKALWQQIAPMVTQLGQIRQLGQQTTQELGLTIGELTGVTDFNAQLNFTEADINRLEEGMRRIHSEIADRYHVLKRLPENNLPARSVNTERPGPVAKTQAVTSQVADAMAMYTRTPASPYEAKNQKALADAATALAQHGRSSALIPTDKGGARAARLDLSDVDFKTGGTEEGVQLALQRAFEPTLAALKEYERAFNSLPQQARRTAGVPLPGDVRSKAVNAFAADASKQFSGSRSAADIVHMLNDNNTRRNRIKNATKSPAELEKAKRAADDAAAKAHAAKGTK